MSDLKDIFTAPFVVEMMKTTANMYRLGWDERNGGNISYMLDEKEVGEYLDLTKVIRNIPIGFEAKTLVGKILIKALKPDVEHHLWLRVVRAGNKTGEKEVCTSVATNF